MPSAAGRAGTSVSPGPRPKTIPSMNCFQYCMLGSSVLYWKQYTCWMRSGDETSKRFTALWDTVLSGYSVLCFKTYHFVFVSILMHPVYSSSGGQETWALVAPLHSLVAGQQACKLNLENKPLIYVSLWSHFSLSHNIKNCHKLSLLSHVVR